MKTGDLPESEDIEDRRDEEPEREPTRVEKQAYMIYDNLRAVAESTDEDAPAEGLAKEAGYDDLPAKASKSAQLAGIAKQSFAAGGPVPSTLKRMTQHPVFPQVQIVRAPVPYLTGSSKDMSKVYIDPRVPEVINVNGKRIHTAAPLAVHELYERAGIQVLQDACRQHSHAAEPCDVYATAHEEVGEQAEKHFLQDHYGFTPEDWTTYSELMVQLAQQIAQAGPQGNPPPDLYTDMYAHAGEAGIDQHPHHLGEKGDENVVHPGDLEQENGEETLPEDQAGLPETGEGGPRRQG